MTVGDLKRDLARFREDDLVVVEALNTKIDLAYPALAVDGGLFFRPREGKKCGELRGIEISNAQSCVLILLDAQEKPNDR